MNEQQYDYLKNKIRKLMSINLDDYRSNQMRRRLDGFITRFNTSDVVAYCHMLDSDEIVLKKLRDFLTINVSEFFRDLDHFETLRTSILPQLLHDSPNLNIWSAGCSNGAEPYSVAIILEMLSPHGNHRILATDIDEGSLKKAIAGGPYKAHEMKNVPEQLLRRFFTSSDGGYMITDRIRQKVEFRNHDLLSDRFERGFDLIMCRNVLIYLSDQTKMRLKQRLHDSLRKDGVLFTGATETMLDTEQMGFNKLYLCFYQKCAARTGAIVC